MKKRAESIVALLHGPDNKGLVASVANWIAEHDGNILHADQHIDKEENIFFQRVEWLPGGKLGVEEEAKSFREMAESKLSMNARVELSLNKPKVALMVSKTDHCFHDLCLRFRAGEMSGDLVCVISNHPDLEESAKYYDLPYYYVEVSEKNKAKAEKEQLAFLAKHDVDCVILARYMQILSPEFLVSVGCPVINIHHSFLPAFVGAKPYHQAYSRGVKLIGATAHYVTTDLDEGPIIHQEVRSVTHRHSVSDLIQQGRDCEKAALAQALKWHLESRILVYNNKTVVFD